MIYISSNWSYKFIPGGGFETDGDIFIPFETFKRLYNTGDDVMWFTIAAYDDADVVSVEKNKAALKRLHNVSPEDDRAFGGFNQEKF